MQTAIAASSDATLSWRVDLAVLKGNIETTLRRARGRRSDPSRDPDQQMATSSDHTGRSIDEIVASTQQVSASIEKTSATAQQIASSAQELAATAESLERLVAKFRVQG